MKKLFLILPIAFCGCAEISEISAPSETIRNSKCENVEHFKVFQAYDSGALATACEEKSYGEMCLGQDVFFPPKKGEEYFDGKRIKVEDGQCFIYEGTYKYTTMMKVQRTLPKVKIGSSDVPNPAYKQWQKERAEREKLNKQ